MDGLNKTISMSGQGLTNKIGNQAVGEFAKNSLNVIAEQGLSKGCFDGFKWNFKWWGESSR